MIFLAKAAVLLRGLLASGMGLKKILSLVVQYAPLISAVMKIFRKEQPPVEGLKEGAHYAKETGDTELLETAVRNHRRDHRGGRLPKRKP